MTTEEAAEDQNYSDPIFDEEYFIESIEFIRT